MSALRSFAAPFVVAALLAISGCASHSDRTQPVRMALNAGNARGAIAALNNELDVERDDELPKDLTGDNALLVLDRGSVQQALAQWKKSQRDFQAADKAIDMLDLSRNAADDIGKYIFSDSSGRYKAPPYEKLLINVLNMVNYLELGDIEGAKVEARRLSVMTTYYKDRLKLDSTVLALGGFLAGYTYERAGDYDEALRYYEDALRFGRFDAALASAAMLMPKANYTSPILTKALAGGANVPPADKTDDAEIIVVVGYGRIPTKIAKRVPIGLALTYFSGALQPTDVAAANRLAAQGLVTWVNYPSLGVEKGAYDRPSAKVDATSIPLEQAVNVTQEVTAEWRKMEGAIVASAITRLIVRYAAGEGTGAAVKAAAGNDGTAGALGFLASLVVQGTLTATDTPDTRSWETLPARVEIARVRVAPGKHRVSLQGRGYSRTQDVDLAPRGFALVSLMALR
jgi:tetratricopeptide (TPR) repeat protein